LGLEAFLHVTIIDRNNDIEIKSKTKNSLIYV
jgi:hypothetical protein